MKLFKKHANYLIVLIPIVTFYGLFFNYTVDIPINDDYAILDFLNKCISTDSVLEKLKLIFSQHNEHRIVYDRIWTIISYKINGKVDFNFLALIGNLSLIGIFLLFSSKSYNRNNKFVYVFAISILVFNISFHENITFAMASLSNFTVYLFSLLSLHFLTKESLNLSNTFVSILFLILAALTQASGLFIIPIGLLILFYKKEKKFLSIYTFISLLIILLYFYGYQRPFNSPSMWTTFVDFKVRALLFSFAFLGNAFDYNLIFTNDLNESVALTTIIGFVFFIFYLFTIKTEYYKKNLFAFSVMSLIIITSFITGLTRCQMGLETAGSSRYRINGVLFLLAGILWFIDLRKSESKKVQRIFFLTSILYFLFFSINQYEYLSYRKRQSLIGALNYQSGDHSKLNGFEQDLYKKILVESAAENTYFLPSFQSLQNYFPYSNVIIEKETMKNPDNLNFRIEQLNKVKDSYLIEGWAFIEKESANNQEVFIGLKNLNQSYPTFYSTNQIPKYDLNPYFNKFNLLNAGFFARIKYIDIPLGENTIWIMLKNNNKTKLTETDKKIIK